MGENGVAAAVEVRTRHDDGDRFGHVNNAAYLALLRAAHDLAADAADTGVPRAGTLRELEIAYREQVAPDEPIRVTLRVLTDDASLLRMAYEMNAHGRRAASATAAWVPPGAPMLPLKDPSVEDRPAFRFTHEVRSYEVGPDGSVAPRVLLEWLEHAVFRAAARAGWSVERMEAEDFVTLVVGHRLRLGGPVGIGERVEVVSRLVEVRRASGTWHHRVRRQDGVLVADDRARGAFLTGGGRLRSLPLALRDALLRGEPT